MIDNMRDYDRIGAVRYAQKWALSRNPNYFDFSDFGGDCTNFISQSLIAGGGVMYYDKIKGWFYENSYNRSASWSSVFYFEKFILNNKTKGPVGHIENVYNLEIGDLIQLRQGVKDFNHTVIISKIENEEIYVCAHSDDSLNRKLSDYYFLELQGIKIDGILI